MNFLEFAVWGAYLTSMGRYLGANGFGANIGWFYSVQGIVSLFMPALMGIVADRWIPAQKLLSLCHALAGLFMCAVGWFAYTTGAGVTFAPLFTLYTISVAFFMPTIALTNSVAFNALIKANMDTVKDFPPIRVFGTIGFIVTMWIVDLLGAMDTPGQFVISGGLSLVLAAYSLTLPACEVGGNGEKKSLVDALGLRALRYSKRKRWLYSLSSLCSLACACKSPTVTPILSWAVLPHSQTGQIRSAYSIRVFSFRFHKSRKHSAS